MRDYKRRYKAPRRKFHPSGYAPNSGYTGPIADEALWSQFIVDGLSVATGSQLLQSVNVEEDLESLEFLGQTRDESPSATKESVDLDGNSNQRDTNLTLSGSVIPFMPELGSTLNTLTEVANRINEADPAVARILALRLVGGFTLRQIAVRTGQQLSVVRRDWESAKHWMAASPERIIGSGFSGSLVTLAPVDVSLLKSINQHPDLLRTLEWRTFEKLLAEVLDRLGYEIELQRGTKDGGIDIFALRHDGTFGSHKYIIQAKRWSNRVGVGPVRELLFLQEHHRVSKGCLATTANFTKGAWQLAGEYRWHVELRDFEGLQDWIAQAVRSQRPR
jgi:hypothetical protein